MESIRTFLQENEIAQFAVSIVIAFFFVLVVFKIGFSIIPWLVRFISGMPGVKQRQAFYDNVESMKQINEKKRKEQREQMRKQKKYRPDVLPRLPDSPMPPVYVICVVVLASLFVAIFHPEDSRWALFVLSAASAYLIYILIGYEEDVMRHEEYMSRKISESEDEINSLCREIRLLEEETKNKQGG